MVSMISDHSVGTRFNSYPGLEDPLTLNPLYFYFHLLDYINRRFSICSRVNLMFVSQTNRLACGLKVIANICATDITQYHHQPTEGCMGEQASFEFDLTFGDVLLHKLVQAH